MSGPQASINVANNLDEVSEGELIEVQVAFVSMKDGYPQETAYVSIGRHTLMRSLRLGEAIGNYIDDAIYRAGEEAWTR